MILLLIVISLFSSISVKSLKMTHVGMGLLSPDVLFHNFLSSNTSCTGDKTHSVFYQKNQTSNRFNHLHS